MPDVTGDGNCTQTRLELGVYLLGAVEPAHRVLIDHHLATCPPCRAVLADLADLPAPLRRVPADEAFELSLQDPIFPMPEPPPGALLKQIARIRRRKSILTAVTAMIAGIAATLGLQALRTAASSPATAMPPHTITVEAAGPATGAWAAIRSHNPAVGQRTRRSASHRHPIGTRCQLIVTTTRGQKLAVGGWTIAASHQAAWCPASVPLQAANLLGFESPPTATTL